MRIIYQDDDLLVYDKPAGINSDDIPMRIHRLDKDTSGIFLIAKNDKALEFFQRQFKERKVEKKYLALTTGNIKKGEGLIETLLGRSPADRRKQKVYLPHEPGAAEKRSAETHYQVLQRFKDYDLIEAEPKTGRKHQIRAHLAHLGHPIAGDKMYSFKNQALQKRVKMKQGFIDEQSCPKRLKRQFLHASQLKITLPNGEEKTFKADLPEELKEVLTALEKQN